MRKETKEFIIGYDKDIDYKLLVKPILEKVSKLILFGYKNNRIYETIVKEYTKIDPKLVYPIYRQKTLEQTVERAYGLAKPGEIVIFSPSSPSLDECKSYKERSEKFREAIMGI